MLLRYAAVILVITIFTTVVRWQFPRLLLPFDIYLLAVVTVALNRSPMRSQVFGLAAGLVKDAFRSGVIGINALSFTIIGFVVASLKEAVLIQGLFQQLFTYAVATVAHLFLLKGIHAVFSLPFEIDWVFLGLRVVCNTVAGLFLILYSRRRQQREQTVRAYERS